MGSILSFKPRKAAPKRTSATAANGMIIIFPGVRYERLDGNTASKPWPATNWLPVLQPAPLPQT